jgi:hypothetical protein
VRSARGYEKTSPVTATINIPKLGVVDSRWDYEAPRTPELPSESVGSDGKSHQGAYLSESSPRYLCDGVVPVPD